MKVRGRAIVAVAATTLSLGGYAAAALAPSAHADTVPGAVSGAIMTTDAAGAAVNANQYLSKDLVYLSGGPNTASAHFLEAGDYFFAVLVPSRQSDPNDGGVGNLSSGHDTAAARSFHADGLGHLTPLAGSTHAFSGAGVVQLAPFDDTTNNGGVYIAAVCQFVPDATSTGGATPVNPQDCKYDAFKVSTDNPVTSASAPTADKTAVPSHVRKVHWTITKTVDGQQSEHVEQSTARTLNYAVTVSKTVDYDTFGVTGSVTVHNPNADPITADVTDDGLDPAVTGSSCQLVGSGSLVVPGRDAATLDDGEASVNYTCAFDPAAPPSPATSYTNTATVSYDLNDGKGPQALPVASDPFYFPAATLASDSAPDTITVTDAFDGGAPVPLTPATTSSDYTWSYQRSVFNANCHTYSNIATILETTQTAQTSVDFCGPNSGGLTMGWWQNKNGQKLLTANVSGACRAWNGYVGDTPTGATNVNYLPDAYTPYYKSSSSYNYQSTGCSAPTSNNKSYLPAFDLNVFAAANASGTGTWMVEGQYLTSVLNTASGYVNAGAGVPSLNPGLKVQIPLALRSGSTTGIGLQACDTVDDLLRAAAAQYGTYASGKTAATGALITLLTKINQNQAQTCS